MISVFFISASKRGGKVNVRCGNVTLPSRQTSRKGTTPKGTKPNPSESKPPQKDLSEEQRRSQNEGRDHDHNEERSRDVKNKNVTKKPSITDDDSRDIKKYNFSENNDNDENISIPTDRPSYYTESSVPSKVDDPVSDKHDNNENVSGSGTQRKERGESELIVSDNERIPSSTPPVFFVNEWESSSQEPLHDHVTPTGTHSDEGPGRVSINGIMTDLRENIDSNATSQINDKTGINDKANEDTTTSVSEQNEDYDYSTEEVTSTENKTNDDYIDETVTEEGTDSKAGTSVTIEENTILKGDNVVHETDITFAKEGGDHNDTYNATYSPPTGEPITLLHSSWE